MSRPPNALATFILPAAVCGWLAAAAVPVAADVFVLNSGGEIRGELLNPDESPRERYVIKSYAGGMFEVGAAIVTKVVPQKPIEIAYDHVKLEHDDTVEGNWQLAEWCRTNGLTAARTRHLERILELDEHHAEVRRLLGYERVGDRWSTRDEIMEQRGYVKYQGRWRLPQEVELLERRKVVKEIEQGWYVKIRRWRSWLDSEKAAKGKEYLLAIDSPYAVDALLKNLESAKGFSHKEIFAEALANVGTTKAYMTIVEQSIESDNEDFRYFCLDLLDKPKPPAAVTMYTNGLKSKDNRHVNRAAIGLARMGDKTAVQPLIDALITEHKFRVGNGQPGSMSMTFGGGPGNRGSSFGTGGGPNVVIRNIRNHEVLAALGELTGKDFDFDVGAWKAWHNTQKPAIPKVNTRRD